MKNTITIAFLLFSSLVFSQYMRVGTDSISLQDFKKQNQESLKTSGVTQTLKSSQDYFLFQQLAQEKKADTTAYFRSRIANKLEELQDLYFFDVVQVDRLTQDYVQANKVERLVQFFSVEKTPEDKINYTQVYQDVKQGRLSLDQAIKTYIKKDIKPIYIKPGLIDGEIYNDLMQTKPGGYTKLYDQGGMVTFAKLLKVRPSLGYMVFGTLRYKDDSNASEQKTAIYKALSSGKAFNEVTKEFGTTQNEINAGGAVMGSPSLPDPVYEALKNKRVGEYTPEPILMDGNFYVFYIYDLVPYEITDKTKGLFRAEMLSSNDRQILEDQVISQMQNSSGFLLTNEYKAIEKSYRDFVDFSKPNALMWRYKSHSMDYQTLRKEIETYYKNLDLISPAEWKALLEVRIKTTLFGWYTQEFFNKAVVRDALDTERRMLFSEFIYSDLVANEVDRSEATLLRYYNANKEDFKWGEVAQGRVAILSDSSLLKSIEKAILKPEKWEELKKKYDGKLNKENKILVSFQEGEMLKDAEIFTKYKIPFKKGVFSTKMGNRDVIVAVDKILPPSLMSYEEAKPDVISNVTEQTLKKILDAQRAKTSIVVPPAFIQDLERNFKK